MNIAYVRKSNRSIAEVVEQCKKGMQAEGLALIGEKEILNKKGIFLYFFNALWNEKIAETDDTLIGLMPNSIFISEKEGKTSVAILSPQLLAGGPRADDMAATIKDIDYTMRKIVNTAAGVADPKVEAVKMYSTATCAYCRMEKEYLEKNKVAFNLVMVDADRKAGEEMVRKTGQMGVPVTEITFDDGDSEIIIGFDKPRLNELLQIGA